MFNNKLMIMIALLWITIPITAIADDTEIYGTTSVNIQPNVLIILDNSGSMKYNQDVGSVEYNPAVTYTATTTSALISPFPPATNSVYQYDGTTSAGLVKWRRLYTNITSIGCAATRTELLTNGYAFGYRIDSSCTGSTYNLKLGNFINYEYSNANPEYRYIVAQRALSNLLNSAESQNKRFGLMIFNSDSQGGRIIYPCGTPNATISSYVSLMNATDFNTSTPLSETLAEAGLYFGGWVPWFNSTTARTGIMAGGKYVTPIQEACQKNYIILITDGEPTNDNDSKLWNTTYMNIRKIRDYDNDGEDFLAGTNLAQHLDINSNRVNYLPSSGTRFLNDIAAFLKNEDISTIGTGTKYNVQNIFTYTIGLTSDQALLASTADNGGGKYFYATTISGLDAALKAINNSISETSAVFLAPSVPVNRTTKTGQSDWIYLAFFKPQNTGEWLGNIKKFALGKNGEIYGRDADGDIKPKNIVDDLGRIDTNACSFWTTICDDGNDTEKGGLGERLLLRNLATNPRNIYYYTGTESNLTDSTNAFTIANKTALGLTDSVINSVHNFIYDTTSAPPRSWRLGAIIHSEPAVVHYSNTQSVIFVGANDGMLHCFNDTNGDELWGFIPPGQKSKLPELTNAGHEYYVDASPVITYGDVLIDDTQHFPPKYMIFGERRGGSNYYVLDISSYSTPKWQYRIDSGILGTDETLGQSWCKPVVCTMATRTETVAGKPIPGGLTEVFLISGGYDSINQDKPCTTASNCPAAIDDVGKAIFAVNTSATNATAALLNNDTPGLPLFKITDETTGITGGSLKNCIVDVKASSMFQASNGKDITTRIYAGDLGGTVFAFSDDLEIMEVEGVKTAIGRIPDGQFPTKLRLFDAPGKKIFYAPAISRMNNSFIEYVVFGTGDRENPKNTSVQNGIYVVKNNWLNLNPYTKANLVNLTENLIVEGSDDDKETITTNLSENNGWYINFYDPGEKMISAPIITQGYIYFTTYVPKDATAGADPCEGAGAEGSSFLWSIDLRTGIPVHDVNNDGIKTKPERRRQVAVMAQPTLTGNMISTPSAEIIPGKVNSNYFFWRQR
jgi:type IV pilus assembly protein PilY1